MRPAAIGTRLGLLVVALNTPRAPAQDCQLFDAALAAVGATASKSLLIDHTVMGVPQFAFAAYTSVRRGDTAFAREMEPPLRALNATRIPVPSCLSDSLAWQTVSDSVLFSIFRPPGRRWEEYHERFPTTPTFAALSQPIVSGDTATVFVAIAIDRLAGRGLILRFVRDADGHWVKQAEAQLWIS